MRLLHWLPLVAPQSFSAGASEEPQRLSNSERLLSLAKSCSEEALREEAANLAAEAARKAESERSLSSKASAGSYSTYTETAQYYYGAAADPHAEWERTFGDALFAAAEGGCPPGILTFLHDQGVEVGDEGPHIAAANGHVAMLRHLAGRKYELAGPNREGATPAHLAASFGHVEVLKALVDLGLDLGVRDDRNGWSTHHPAARANHTAVIEFIAGQGVGVDRKDFHGVTAAHLAAESGHLAALNLLATLGADPKAEDTNGRSPAHGAARRGSVEVLEALQRYGTSLVAADKHNTTALHIAAEAGHVAVVELLLAQGADAQAVDMNGWTPGAIVQDQDHKALMELLPAPPKEYWYYYKRGGDAPDL